MDTVRIVEALCVCALSAWSGWIVDERFSVGGRAGSRVARVCLVIWPGCYHVETRESFYKDRRRLRYGAVHRHESVRKQRARFPQRRRKTPPLIDSVGPKGTSEAPQKEACLGTFRINFG